MMSSRTTSFTRSLATRWIANGAIIAALLTARPAEAGTSD
jgi:hypothetical protein